MKKSKLRKNLTMKYSKKILLGIFIAYVFIGIILKGTVNNSLNNDSSNKNDNFQSFNDDDLEPADDFKPPPAVPNENFTWGFSNGTEIGFIWNDIMKQTISNQQRITTYLLCHLFFPILREKTRLHIVCN